MRFAYGFAVPACAFAVGLAEEFLVDFGGVGEGVVEAGFGDFVVVVDELVGLGYGGEEVGRWL